MQQGTSMNSENRIHRAVSTGGTQIAGRVLGDGLPPVFDHGGLGDGETSWRFLPPTTAYRLRQRRAILVL